MPDEPVPQVGDLFAQATGAYTGGDTGQAVGLLDEAIATARAGEPEALPYLLVQKAGWLRESGHPSDAEAALGDAIAEVERSRSARPSPGDVRPSRPARAGST